jgi:hypothetical protein
MPNQLIHAASPYLLQHAHNPVNWYPWGDEALQLAQQQNKPILLSIGYAACHWCHVMEKESFEDEKVAALMNQYFINIKVDREERPDIDHIYMDALQALTGSGGWPLNIFLTPNLKPFYGGTYFPTKQAYNRKSWSDVLVAIHKAFIERKNEIDAQAETLIEHLNKSNSFGDKSIENANSYFNEDTLNLIAQNLLQQFDEEWGGFGNAPKFPQTQSIIYLLRHHHFTQNKEALQAGLHSLNKMLQGGIYDHLQGGFARYSVDEKWQAPHFEKMLYDNALLVWAMSEAYQLTNQKIYKTAIEQTLQFVVDEWMNKDAGFYCAYDADSEGVEGKYYTWSKQEIETILKNDAEIFCKLYDVHEHGNWEHTNILWQPISISEFVQQNKLEEKALLQTINKCKQKLLVFRQQRKKPLLDDKIVLSWNALMCTAFCKAYAATGNETYKQIAIKNQQFIQNNMSHINGGLWRCYKKNKPYINAFADDYAYYILALINLQEITGNLEYLYQAKNFMDFLLNNFKDDSSCFFFFTQKNIENIIVQKKEVYDGAMPSANAIAALCLHYLGLVFSNENYLQQANDMIAHLHKAITNYPTSFGCWASLVQQIVMQTNEVVVVGAQAGKALQPLLHAYMPNKIFLSSLESSNYPIELLQHKNYQQPLNIYLCKNKTCHPPKQGITEFLHFYNN